MDNSTDNQRQLIDNIDSSQQQSTQQKSADPRELLRQAQLLRMKRRGESLQDQAPEINQTNAQSPLIPNDVVPQEKISEDTKQLTGLQSQNQQLLCNQNSNTSSIAQDSSVNQGFPPISSQFQYSAMDPRFVAYQEKLNRQGSSSIEPQLETQLADLEQANQMRQPLLQNQQEPGSPHSHHHSHNHSHNHSHQGSPRDNNNPGQFVQMPPDQMARLQNMDPRYQHNRMNKDALTKLTIIAFLVSVNVVAFPEEHVGCQYNSTNFNWIFLMFIALPEMCLRMISLSMWRSNFLLDFRKNFLQVMGPVLYSGWLIYTITAYEDFTPVCYEPYPSFGLVTFCVIMVLILPSAFMVICIASFLLLFCPCISYTVFNAVMDQRERTNLKQNVISNLKKFSFESIKGQMQKPDDNALTMECAICLGPFEEDALVTPLSCDIRHCFHSQCIEQWMQMKNECPLCKTHIDPKSLIEFNKQLERRMREDQA